MELSILAFFLLLLGSLSEATDKEEVLRGEASDSDFTSSKGELRAWPYPNVFGNPSPQNSDALLQIQNSLASLNSGQGTIVSLIGSVLSILQRIQEEQSNLRNVLEVHGHSSPQNTQIPSPINVNTITSVPKEDTETTASPAETSPESPNEIAGESAIDKPPGLGQFLSPLIGGGNVTTGSGVWGAVTGGQPSGNGTWWTSVSNGPNAVTTVTSGSGIGTYSGPQNGVAAGTGGNGGPNSGQGVGTGAGGSIAVGSSSGNVPWGSGHWETVGGGTQGGDGNWWTSVSNGPNGGTTILSGSGFGISSKPGVANSQVAGGGVSTNSGLSEVSGTSPGIALGPVPYFGGPSGWWSGLSTSSNNAGGPNGGFVGTYTNGQVSGQGSGILTGSTFTSSGTNKATKNSPDR